MPPAVKGSSLENPVFPAHDWAVEYHQKQKDVYRC